MIKTLSNLLKQDKEKYKVPRKVQDVIPIRRMWSDGIFHTVAKPYVRNPAPIFRSGIFSANQRFRPYSWILEPARMCSLLLSNQRFNVSMAEALPRLGQR